MTFPPVSPALHAIGCQLPSLIAWTTISSGSLLGRRGRGSAYPAGRETLWPAAVGLFCVLFSSAGVIIQHGP